MRRPAIKQGLLSKPFRHCLALSRIMNLKQGYETLQMSIVLRMLS